MSTITVPRSDVTSQEVIEALRNGLDPRYQVSPGMRMPRSPLFGRPQPDQPEAIMVAASPMVRAQVRILHRPGRTDLQVTPGGVLRDLLLNTFGIAHEIHRVLAKARAYRDFSFTCTDGPDLGAVLWGGQPGTSGICGGEQPAQERPQP